MLTALSNFLLKTFRREYYWKREIQKYTKFKIGDYISAYEKSSHYTTDYKGKVVDFELDKEATNIYTHLVNSRYIYLDLKTGVYDSIGLDHVSCWTLDTAAMVNQSFNADLDKLIK